MSRQFLRKGSLWVVGVDEYTQQAQPDTVGPLNTTVRSDGTAVMDPVEVTASRTQAIPGIDLSSLRFKFKVYAIDEETPPYAVVTVYNLSDARAQAILDKRQKELVIQAGYVDGNNFGQIFRGNIRQAYVGRESPTDTYVSMIACDADLVYNFGIVNGTLKKGSTAEQRLQSIVSQMAKADPTSSIPFQVSYSPDVPLGPPLPRGKVLFGMGRSALRDWGNTANVRYSVQGGQLQIIPRAGYLPGEAVVLNAKSGMVGMPQQTDQGIRVKCLINPNIRIGGLIKLNNKDIISAQIDIKYSAVNNLARFQSDGFYRVYVIEYTGDTRGQEWYADLTCLAADASVISNSVNAGVAT